MEIKLEQALKNIELILGMARLQRAEHIQLSTDMALIRSKCESKKEPKPKKDKD